MSDYNEKLREDFGRRAKAATQAVTDASITGKDLERFKAQMAVINGIIDDNGLMSEAMSALETLELMASNLTSAPAPTGGTPVPAPAAPQPTPATPASPTTPPAAPAPAPDLTQVKQEITSAVKQGIIDLLKPMAEVLPSDANGFVPVASKAEVNDHETRITRLEKGGFDWLVAAVVAIVVALVTFVVMTKGDFGDPVKVLASLAIGIFTGLLVEGTRVGIKSRRSSRNAA